MDSLFCLTLEDECEYKCKIPESTSSNDRFDDVSVQGNSYEHLKKVGFVHLSVNSLRNKFNF